MPPPHTYTGDPAGRSSFYCRTMIHKITVFFALEHDYFCEILLIRLQLDGCGSLAGLLAYPSVSWEHSAHSFFKTPIRDGHCVLIQHFKETTDDD
jgi:hypothetical protein